MSIPHINHALENITTACQIRLSLLYPQGIPKSISSRYSKELSFLSDSDLIDDFEIFRLLSEEAKKSSTPIHMRGTIMGSFIYYLLGVNCFNPLPVHYYCPDCGYYEEINTHLFGIDLPLKKCPHCGNNIAADGFNLSVESVWGNDGKKTITFDYNISTEFLPFARRVLTSIYPDNSIVPWGMFQLNSGMPETADENQIIGISPVGYAILPTGNSIQDYPDLISCLEDGEPCVTGGCWELSTHLLKTIHLYPVEHIDNLLKLQRATGIYANELSPDILRDITWSNICNSTLLNNTSRMLFHELKPKTFKDMVALDSSSHNSFSWNKIGAGKINLYHFQQMISSESFKKYPCFTREDFFDYLLESDIERSLAFDASECIRKGFACSVGERKERFDALEIPDEIKEVAGNYLYLFPRAHGIEYILLYAELAYYAQIDSRAFSKIFFRKSV